ncbi:MAG: ABC transporter permease [bacterium]
MRAIGAILKKELGLYFHSFIFYFFGFIFTLLSGFILTITLYQFVRQTPMGGQFTVQYVVQGVFGDIFGILLLMFLPFFTMRLLAEERRQGSLELLFTSPVTATQVTMGKFLAAFLLLAGILSVPLIYPATLDLSTRVDWLPVLAIYLGALLIGGTYVAIGLFFSSVTQNQFIAAVLTLGAFLFFWLIGYVGHGTPAQPVFQYLSMLTHREEFGRGVINTQDVVYYLSSIFGWLFLTNRSLESQGWR